MANRLAAPSPLYDIARWGSSSALQEVFGIPGMLLNDDRLGRALEDFAARAEEIRGTVALAAIERFGVEAGQLHLDLTARRVSGAYEKSDKAAMQGYQGVARWNGTIAYSGEIGDQLASRGGACRLHSGDPITCSETAR